MEKRRKGIASNKTEREEEKGRIKGERRNDTSRLRGVWRFSRAYSIREETGNDIPLNCVICVTETPVQRFVQREKPALACCVICSITDCIWFDCRRSHWTRDMRVLQHVRQSQRRVLSLRPPFVQRLSRRVIPISKFIEFWSGALSEQSSSRNRVLALLSL